MMREPEARPSAGHDQAREAGHEAEGRAATWA